MNKAAIYHESIDNLSYPLDDNSLRVRLITAKNDLKKVSIIYGPKFDFHKDPVLSQKMEVAFSDQNHDYYTVKIHLKDPRFRYHFLLEDYKANKYWYNEKGFFENRPRGHECGFFQYPIITDWEKYNRPDWLNKAVIYQIFPDRFNNGDLSLNPAKITRWGDKPESDSTFGGDLEGIIQKLDYLKELGINTIYLTPIFSSDSNHKYNIEDYYKIDKNFGDLKKAKELVKKAHEKDIKIILDAVFNHCDINFFAFKDLIEKKAESEYKNWFYYEKLPLQTELPINYVTFATQVKSMPKLNTANNEVQKYLLKVAQYWTKNLKIDGWRLDVADEVDMTFWRKFREQVKKINPNVVIIGEIWHNARKWLRGDRFDTVMNYPFNWAVLKFFAQNKIGVERFSSLIVKSYIHYREDTSQVLLNLLSSHDIPRFYEYCDNKDQLKLAILFLFTYPGIPMVYYGDEFGLKGGKDPDNRRCMPWGKEEDYDLFNFYKKLIDLRKKETPLHRGDFKIILQKEVNNIIAFRRKFKNKTAYIVLNNNHILQNIEINIERSGNYRELINEDVVESDNSSLLVTLEPYQGKIFIHP